ncbi:MAG: peptide ABC transporter substrate-binding protein [Christensenellaceae bacterium]|nr:peptide ABC transporter substrate-binding protein [Christensenellaceae bacterium]
MKRARKRALCALLCLLCLLPALPGCEGRLNALQQASPARAAGAEAEPDEKTECWAVLGKRPKGLDPCFAEGEDELSYATLLFEGLFRYNAEGKIEYGAAASAHQSADGLSWTLRLREDALWQDGSPVTAGDFVFAWRRFFDPRTQAPLALDLGEYFENGLAVALGEMDPKRLGVSAVDDRTLEVQLSAPCAWFDEVLAFPPLAPAREDYVARADYMQSPEGAMGNGRYVWLGGEEESLRFEKAQSGGEGPDGLRFSFDDGKGGPAAGLRSGALQYAAGENGEIEGYERLETPKNGSLYLVFNQNGPFVDEKLREAFSLAINPEAAAEALRAIGEPVEPAYALFGEGFVSFSGLDFYKEGGPLLDRAADRRTGLALDALKAAGGEPRQMPVLLCYEDAKQHALAEALQGAWKNTLGYGIEARFLPWEEYVEAYLGGDYDMASWFWAMYFSAPPLGLEHFMAGSPYNSSGFADESFDALVRKARELGINAAAGRSAMHEAEKKLVEGFVVAPVYHHLRVSMRRLGAKLHVLPSGIVLFG